MEAEQQKTKPFKQTRNARAVGASGRASDSESDSNDSDLVHGRLGGSSGVLVQGGRRGGAPVGPVGPAIPPAGDRPQEP